MDIILIDQCLLKSTEDLLPMLSNYLNATAVNSRSRTGPAARGHLFNDCHALGLLTLTIALRQRLLLSI